MVIIGNIYIYCILYRLYVDTFMVSSRNSACHLRFDTFWGLWDLDDIEDLHVRAEASPALRRLAKWLGASLSTWSSKLLFKTLVAWLVMKDWSNRDFNIWQPCRDIKWIKLYKLINDGWLMIRSGILTRTKQYVLETITIHEVNPMTLLLKSCGSHGP